MILICIKDLLWTNIHISSIKLLFKIMNKTSFIGDKSNKGGLIYV